jgi:medium-chain acyl-[acyl-carrier-protein] hydrolase
MQVYCLPHAGAGASIFREWSRDLPSSITVCPIQLPGREQRFAERLCTHIDPLVEGLCDSLAPRLQEQPYALFGHSMGALIAFEMTRTIVRRGLAPPRHLFVAARRGPSLPSRYPAIHDWPDARFLAEVSQFSGTPPELLQDVEFAGAYLPILRADFSICETYTYEAAAALPCPITALGGTDDSTVTLDELWAWDRETTAEMQVRTFSGDHFFLHSCRARLLQVIAQTLSSRLAA